MCAIFGGQKKIYRQGVIVLNADGYVFNVVWYGVEHENDQFYYKILKSAGVLELLCVCMIVSLASANTHALCPDLDPDSGQLLGPEDLNVSICYWHPILRKETNKQTTKSLMIYFFSISFAIFLEFLGVLSTRLFTPTLLLRNIDNIFL